MPAASRPTPATVSLATLAAGVALTALALLVPVGEARGQGAPAAPGGGGAAAPTAEQVEMMRTLHRAARNQLGVFTYCQGRGALGPEAVSLQRRMIGMLPPATGVDGLDEAEATGRRGVVSFAGNTASLEDAARAQNTTVEALCRTMGEALATQARAAGLTPPG